ncbi:MAG: polymer-forming cytoskeletal protein, partial [Rhodospirillales bacterium]|nr:polymer-forming cytoskeletal protein [Rhodospirillales bacterium]
MAGPKPLHLVERAAEKLRQSGALNGAAERLLGEGGEMSGAVAPQPEPAPIPAAPVDAAGEAAHPAAPIPAAVSPAAP